MSPRAVTVNYGLGAPETGVEKRREVVERILRRPVGAKHDVLAGRDVFRQLAIVLLPAHDAGVGVRRGSRVEAAASVPTDRREA